jgi:hypothetical protein
MTMPWRARGDAIVLIVATALMVASVTTVRAAMVERMSLEEVAHEAARIVHATVVEVRSGRDESGLPATWITLAVVRTLKGPHTPQLTIKQYGVAEPLPDGTITRVAGLPRYRVGEEVVLFLRADSARGFTSPVGFSQGAYRVSRTDSVPQVRSDLGARGPRSLDEFLAEITGLVNRAH